MTFDELLAFIEEEDTRLRAMFPEPDEGKRLLSSAVKLSEEVGELCDAILRYLNGQRKEKLDRFTQEDLENELADVLIVTLTLARTTGVDVREALAHKIKKIKDRYSKQ